MLFGRIDGKNPPERTSSLQSAHQCRRMPPARAANRARRMVTVCAGRRRLNSGAAAAASARRALRLIDLQMRVGHAQIGRVHAQRGGAGAPCRRRCGRLRPAPWLRSRNMDAVMGWLVSVRSSAPRRRPGPHHARTRPPRPAIRAAGRAGCRRCRRWRRSGPPARASGRCRPPAWSGIRTFPHTSWWMLSLRRLLNSPPAAACASASQRALRAGPARSPNTMLANFPRCTTRRPAPGWR